MNKADFEHRLLLFGGSFERWPPDEAQAAQRLLDQDASAQALLDEARALELMLTKAVADDTAESALTGQILTHVMSRTQWRGLAHLSKWRLAGAGVVLASAAAVGFAIGVFVTGLSTVTNDAMLMSMAGVDSGVWLLQ